MTAYKFVPFVLITLPVIAMGDVLLTRYHPLPSWIEYEFFEGESTAPDDFLNSSGKLPIMGNADVVFDLDEIGTGNALIRLLSVRTALQNVRLALSDGRILNIPVSLRVFISGESLAVLNNEFGIDAAKLLPGSGIGISSLKSSSNQFQETSEWLFAQMIDDSHLTPANLIRGSLDNGAGLYSSRSEINLGVPPFQISQYLGDDIPVTIRVTTEMHFTSIPEFRSSVLALIGSASFVLLSYTKRHKSSVK